MGSKQQVLCGSTAIHHIIAVVVLQLVVAADQDGFTGGFKEGGIGMDLHDTVEHFAVRYHDEMPGLAVHS
jgi:hypothetical protein